MDLLAEFTRYTVWGLIGAVALILLYLVWVSARNPVLMKIGLRNLARRPAQAVLIVIGLTLSTIIVISAFGTGDTLRYSVERQAVAAYGEVDEIIAPPILSMLANLGEGNAEADTAASELEQTVGDLQEGGLASILALARGGLPSLEMARLEQLRAEAAGEPLIDGVAGAIVFPTILRNVSNGAGEPLGFIYAVDDRYPENFGLTSTDGAPLEMTSLQPGVGNIFLQASNLFAAIPQMAANLGGDQLIAPAAQVLAAAGALFTGVAAGELPALKIDLATLEELGVDTTPLRNLGIETLDVETLARTLGLADPEQTAAAVDEQVGALADSAGNLLQAINLNTLGYTIDEQLGRFGLQLRQGDVYLSRLAAERLAAQPGDILEVYIGPLPVRFRVKAVVDQAGPLSALLPVVMLRLTEAQELLFMHDRINAVLVSNLGDELEGVQYSDEVSQRLAVLALDPPAVEQVMAILRRPNVANVVLAAAAEPPPTAMPDEDAPAIVRAIVGEIAGALGLEVVNQAQLDAIHAVVAGDAGATELREPLAAMNVREWLLDLDNLSSVDRADLRTALAGLNRFEQIQPLNKSTILTVANVGSGVFSSVFSLFGFFSVLAAILLIFLIFVMLAAERRSEIGIARAVGTQRSQIVQTFITEGMVYALLAAVLGVVIGIGVTWAMTQFLGQIFNNITGQIGGQLNNQGSSLFSVTFHISWQSVVISYCLGVLLTFIVITIASWRVSRTNIVTAIRDLPDRSEGRPRTWLQGVWRWLFPLLVVAGGVALLVWMGRDQLLSLALIALTLLLFGGMLLVGRVLERTRLRRVTIDRIVYTTIGLGLLALWVTPWSTFLPQLLPSGWLEYNFTQAPILFVLGGPLIITGTILALMYNADFLAWLIASIFGFIPALRPVLRTAIAYPLNARFRTGMTMILFAMIMATVVVMAVVIHATQSLVRQDIRSTAGFEIQVSPTLLSFFSPVADFNTELAAHAGEPGLGEIAAVGQIYRQVVRARADQDGGGPWLFAEVDGLSDGYLQQAAHIYPLQARAAGYASDADVWEALRTRDDVAVILPRTLDAAALSAPGPGAELDATEEGIVEERIVEEDEADSEGFDQNEERRRRRAQWDRDELFFPNVAITDGVLPELTVELEADVTNGEAAPPPRRVQIIGVLADDTTLAESGIQTGMGTLAAVMGDNPLDDPRTYIKVAEGGDVHATANAIERAFLPNGLSATILAEQFQQAQQLTASILRLLQGFMALGLLVGIAALGVISTRAVVERRQQVGMLRAIGFQKRMVGLSFLLESSFISICGLLIGALTGVVLGGTVLRTFFPDVAVAALGEIPWGTIAGMVLAAYLFSLLTTILPVWQAARIYPAEALRYE